MEPGSRPKKIRRRRSTYTLPLMGRCSTSSRFATKPTTIRRMPGCSRNLLLRQSLLRQHRECLGRDISWRVSQELIDTGARERSGLTASGTPSSAEIALAAEAGISRSARRELVPCQKTLVGGFIENFAQDGSAHPCHAGQNREQAASLGSAWTGPARNRRNASVPT